MKKQAVTQVKLNAPKNLFNGVREGTQSFKALKHKNNNPYTDLEYMELLGRTCIEKDKNNEPYFYDKNAVAVAKEIVRGRDELNMTTGELKKYLVDCLDLSELN